MKGVFVLGFAILATLVAHNVAMPHPGPPPPEAVFGLRTLLDDGKGFAPGLGNLRGAGFAQHERHGPGCRGRGNGSTTAAPTNTTASG